MQRIWRIIWRATVIAMLVQFCGAAACLTPVADIGYVKGRGYVVTVEQDPTPLAAAKHKTWYVFFPTEKEAQDFYNRHATDGNWRDEFRNIPADRKINDLDDGPEFDEVQRQLQPPPPDQSDVLAPMTRSTLPDPIPPTPQ